MKAVACVDAYRGFIFVRLSHQGPDLVTWLGEARTSIDNMVDRSPDGSLEAVGEPLRYINDCNWKMLVENISDNMHPLSTHMSVSAAAKTMANQINDSIEPPIFLGMLTPFGNPLSFFEGIEQTICGNGHSYTGGVEKIHSNYPEVLEYREAMIEAYGEKRTKEILSMNRHNTVIYPSISIKCNLQSMRVFRPISANETLLETWTF